MSVSGFFDHLPGDWGQSITAVTLFRSSKPMLGYTAEWAREFVGRYGFGPHAMATVGLAYSFALEDAGKLDALRHEIIRQFSLLQGVHGPYGQATMSMLTILMMVDDKLKDLLIEVHTTQVHLTQPLTLEVA